MSLVFEPTTADLLNRLAEDDSAVNLVDSIWDTLDLIDEEPTSKFARRRAFRTVGGESVWLVPVPERYQDDRWIILWKPQGDDALIAYVGPESFKPPAL